MTESYPTDASLNALSGTTDSEQEVLFVTTGESPYYTSYYKMLYRLLDVARRAADLRVFKDGALTFGVRAGKFFNADAEVNYAGAAAQALTNNATNYIYLTAAGVLTINTAGFPVPSVTPHIPLATIVTAAGDYTPIDGDLVDVRGRAIFSVCGGASGSLNMLDWQESVADELDFTSAEPASPTLGDRYRNTGTGASSETGQTVAANDIEEWNGTSWTEITPTEGACCLVEDRDMLIGYNGSAWVDIGTFALLNEAQAFFAATDISGAEAETLTDGSNADALHDHTLDTGVTDVTATAAEVNGVCDGATATAANLNTLTGGGQTSGLHLHTRGELAQDNKTYTLSLADMRQAAAVKDALPDAADAIHPGLADAAGSVITSLETVGPGIPTIAEHFATDFVLPAEYVAGQAVTVRLRAKISAVQNHSPELDLEAREMGDTGLGSDICATASQAPTTSYADYDFTITPTTLSVGDVLHCKVKMKTDDTGGMTAGYMTVSKVSVFCAVRG